MSSGITSRLFLADYQRLNQRINQLIQNLCAKMWEDVFVIIDATLLLTKTYVASDCE